MSDPRPHRRVEVDVPDRVEELDAVAHRALERLGAAHLSDHDAIWARRECAASRPGLWSQRWSQTTLDNR
jgi:hypothetical protein